MTPQSSTCSMKDSGIEWVGQVPSHWSVRPFYSFAAEVDHPNTGLKERNLLSLSYGRLVRKDMDRLEGLTPASFEGYNIIEANDIVFRLTDLQNDKNSLRSARSPERGIITSAYVTVRPAASPRFFEYLMRAYDTTKVFYGIGGGIRQSMKFDDLKRLPVVVPPVTEMDAIASHLDRATARIDALVAKKTRFIELLREKRQALITHAVTKGLDRGAPMKDSGVEWLGVVPAHWSVFRFKQSTISCQNGLWGTDPNGVDDIECVRVADFNRPALKVNPGIPTLRAITEKERSGRLLKRGNLLIEKSGGGENQPVGQVVLYDRDASAICSNFVAKIELAPGMDQRFWNYQHHAAYAARVNVKSIKQTSGIQNLDHHQYLDELAVFPPANEQTAIADHLDRATTRIDTLISKTERSIELLREHRTALITAAVTGKIDLRPAA